MRRRVLFKSIRKLLRDDEDLMDAAFMWSRHRLMIPYALVVFAVLLGVAVLAGYQSWVSRLGVGAAGAGIAAMATTNYRVLAQTSRGFVLFRASRVRQYAVEPLERWQSPPEMKPTTSYSVATDWMLDNRRYTVPKSSERAMARMAAG